MRRFITLSAVVAGAALLAPSEAVTMPMFPVTISGGECLGALVPADCVQPSPVDWTLQSDGTFSDTFNYVGTWTYDAVNTTATLSYNTPLDLDGDGIVDMIYTADYVGAVVGSCVPSGQVINQGAQQGIWQGCVVP